jgi:hypothetical protein
MTEFGVSKEASKEKSGRQKLNFKEVEARAYDAVSMHIYGVKAEVFTQSLDTNSKPEFPWHDSESQTCHAGSRRLSPLITKTQCEAVE